MKTSEKESGYFLDNLLNDNGFISEVEEMLDADSEECEDCDDEDCEGEECLEERAGPDCGTGGGGFKAGNSCAKGGQATGSKKKPKTKKDGGKAATSNQLVGTATEQLNKSGGFTVHPISGKSPTKGYMVATVPGQELVTKKLTANKLGGFIQKNSANFSKDKGLHVGGWYNKKNGKIYVDLSSNVSSLAKAKTLAKKHKQIAIWDVANKDEINTEELWRNYNANGQTRSLKAGTRRTRSTRGRVSTKREATGRERGLNKVRFPTGGREEPGSHDESHPRDDGKEQEIRAPDCGTGGGGFKAGNSCAKGGQAVGSQKDGKKQSSDSGKKSSGGAAVAEQSAPPDAFLDGSAKFRGAIDSTTDAMGKESTGIWDRSKGFLPLPSDEVVSTVAAEQKASAGKPISANAKASYQALNNEVGQQYQSLVDSGLKVYAWRGEGEPYGYPPGSSKPNSALMRRSIADSGEYKFFMTEKGFGTGEATQNHPMMQKSKFKTSDGESMLQNDVFRVVHDIVAHERGGNSFSTRGEYNGMITHASTLPKKAWPALFSETFAQNAVYETTKKFAGQHAYYPKTATKFIEGVFTDIGNMKQEDQQRAFTPNEGIDSDEPLGYQHIKSRPWLIKDSQTEDTPTEEKEDE